MPADDEDAAERKINRKDIHFLMGDRYFVFIPLNNSGFSRFSLRRSTRPPNPRAIVS